MASEDDVLINVEANLTGNAAAGLDALASSAGNLAQECEADQAALLALAQAEAQVGDGAAVAGQSMSAAVAAANQMGQAQQQAFMALINGLQQATAAAAAAQQQTAQSTQAMAQVLQDQQANGGDMVSSGYGGSGGMGGHGGPLMLASGRANAQMIFRGLSSGDPTMAMAAGVGMVEGSLKLGTEALNAFGNATLSTEEKVLEITKDIPIVGGMVSVINSFADACLGVTEKLRLAAEGMAIAQSNISANTSIISAQQSYFLKTEQAQNQVELASGITPDYGQAPDPNTDPKGYAQWVANIPLAQKAAVAERAQWQAAQMLAATQFQASAGGQLGQMLGSANIDVMAANAAAQAAMDQGGVSKVRATQIYDNQLIAYQEQQAMLKLQGSNLNQQVQEAQAQGNAEHQQRQVGIEKQQQQLGILGQETQVAVQQTTTMGGMDEASLLAVQQAQQQFQDFGLDSLSDAQRQLINQAGGGQWLQAQFLQAGETGDNAEMIQAIRDGFALAGDQYTGQSVQGLQTQKVDLQNLINLDVQLDAELVAKYFADKMIPIFKKIEDNTKALAESQRKERLLKIKGASPLQT